MTTTSLNTQKLSNTDCDITSGVRIFALLMFIFMLFQPSGISSQNLVLNTSFEGYCRDSLCGVIYFYNDELPSVIYGCRVTDWSNPTNGSPDYLHSELDPPLVITSPTSGIGYQYPLTGEAYCHIACCKYEFMEVPHFREYIQGKFSKPLQSGCKYLFGFHVVYTESSIFASKLGIGFTQDSVYYNTMDCLMSQGFYPDLETDVFITDTANWTKVEWIYTATGGERFFTIGNFWCDTIESFQFTDSSGVLSNGLSGYFFDDFFMYELTDTMSIHNVYIPNVFSPDGNGQNDVFRIRGAAISEIKTFLIFNRWGEEVFSCRTSTQFTPQNAGLSVTSTECGWDGTCRGEPAPQAVYTYYVEVVLLNGETVVKRGNVTLVR